MKKILIVIAAFVVLVLLAAVLVPVIFKDDIKNAIDTEMSNSLDANVYYDTDKVSITLFSHFPNLTLRLSEFGIAGKDLFTGDTLVDVRDFEITVDLMSAISGNEIVIRDVLLNEPRISILVLEDGSANYDIAKSSGEKETEEPETSSEPSDLSIAINNWEIRNGDIVYYDQSLPMYATLFGFNHQGSGDFSQDVFDMVTNTTINDLSFGYEGDEYVSGKTLSADIVMGMDLGTLTFTFKENKLSLNDFGFGFDGSIAMPDSEINMDITFAGREIDMKSILSLIPGLYQEYLDGVNTSGNVGFDGYVRGTYSEESMPKIAANFSVDNGKISYADYPIPMEQIQINSSFDYPSADLSETSFTIDNFSMLVDGEKLSASLLFKDLEDYFWDLKVDGSLDLEKVMRIIPVEETELTGKVLAQLATSGRMSDLEAEQYQKLETSGSLQIEGLKYTSDVLPQGFGIARADASFNPSEISLATFEGNAGKTDLNLSGKITNYLQYALEENAVLYGDFRFSSRLVDINEWMVSEDTVEEEEETEDTTSMEIIRIPANIDFVLASSIEQLVYDNMNIRNFKGEVIIRDGSLLLEGVDFNLLDGTFKMNGRYTTAAEGDPTFDFDFAIEELSIPEAFRTFSTVQKLVPFAEKLNGKFSTDFKLGGAIGEGMMPVYSTLDGEGLIEVAQAAMQDVKLLSAVSSVSKLKQKDGSVNLKDVLLSAEVKDGSVFVQPFTVTMGGYKATIAGSNTIDGQLNYAMVVKDVETGAVGQAVTSALSSVGIKSASAEKVDVNFGIGGSFTDPKVKLLGANPSGSSSDETLAGSVKSKVKDQVDEKKEEAKEIIAETKKEAKDSAKAVVAETKKEVEKKTKKEVEKAKDKAEDAIKDLFGKKKKKKKKKKGGGI